MSRYRYYVLAMLTLVYVFNFVDRQIVVILAESIKKDMHLTDADLGWLSGVAFAFFYVILGIPIARFADRGNRKNVITVSLGLWSIMTAVCGFAGNFFQLLLARIGVGIGEAGGSPPAHAMLSDYFPPRKRSTALAIYSAGIYIGMMVGFVMGGYLNQSLGWRKAFMLVGAPGAVFALLVFFTVREPKRGATDDGHATDDAGATDDTGATDDAGATETHSFRVVVKRLISSPTFVFLAMATSLHVFCIYGLANWAPSFLSRLHGLTPAQRGLALGLASGIGGGIGSFGGGWLTDRFGKRDIRWYMRIPAIAVLISVVFEVLALFSPNTSLSVISFGCIAALQSSYLGPAVSVAHRLVPASMRAMASASLFLCLNLIGLGLGPVVVGKISDLLAPRYGVESLRWAMSVVILVSFGAMALFFVTARKMKAELS